MKLMLAKNWTSNIDPTGWYMSEKLDGIRAIWTGQEFVSRNEKPFVAPCWFTKGLPKRTVLDGELWIGRGKFNETSGQVRRKTNQDWSNMKYMIFDIPLSGTFKSHITMMGFLKLPDFIQILKQTVCVNSDHLIKYEMNILSNGGEGVILHHPNSLYIFGKRSDCLLKVKRFKEDEATVVGYLEGRGKHKGRMGALLCKYKKCVIKIGTGFTNSDRVNPPTIGKIVTFKYFELSKYNIPRFPVYKGVRWDN